MKLIGIRQQVSSGPVGVAPKSSLSGGMGKQVESPDSQKGQRVSFAESSRVFPKTRRCPACESGMDAPGSRHNAECKRRRKAFEAQNSPESVSSPGASTEMHSPSTPERFVDAPVDGGTPTQGQELDTRVDVDGDTNMPEVGFGSPTPVGDMDSSSVGDDRKRTADVDVSDLEKQIREDPMMDSLFVHQEPEWCCSMSCQPLQHLGETDENGFQRITSPELFSSDETVSAIQFRPDTKHESVTVRLGGGKVRVWKPDTIIDDQTLESLDTNLGFEGMQEEVNNLEACQTGDLLSEAEAKAVQKVNKSARVIGARWVCAFKSAIRVRCRIVAKDLARGTSARKMGYSSPTPSCESLHLMLILCATLNLFLRSLDISHAFMHSPLEDQIVLLRLPLSVSLCDGSVAFLKLKRALNGLRDASLAWLRLLAGTIQGQGLWSDTLEPCFYQGKVLDSKGNELGIAMLLVYVDDILLATSCERTESVILRCNFKSCSNENDRQNFTFTLGRWTTQFHW